MKLLVLLALLASAPQPPAVRVTFSSLSKTAYLAAQKGRVATNPRTTFPLRKQGRRIMIPTAKGRKIFTDISEEEARKGQEPTTYTHLGYWPALHCHVLKVLYYETAQYFLVTDAGRQLELWGEPLLAPDGQHVVSICTGLEYGGGQPNNIQLLALQSGALREVWHLEPKTWEPQEICWTSPTTLLLSKEMWTGKNPGTIYTYAQLTLK